MSKINIEDEYKYLLKVQRDEIDSLLAVIKAQSELLARCNTVQTANPLKPFVSYCKGSGITS